jgi:hypothetical protein
MRLFCVGDLLFRNWLLQYYNDVRNETRTSFVLILGSVFFQLTKYLISFPTRTSYLLDSLKKTVRLEPQALHIFQENPSLQHIISHFNTVPVLTAYNDDHFPK